ncbi:MAG TPA: aldo/keto reductase [Acidimicrobiales bacterium]|nr:aldo/keto reductase [Acidimicrobiales bacterium]
MDYRRLGRSGLRVSAITLGTAGFGTKVPDDHVRRLVDQALDAGVNLIDTADAYGAGRSEEILGEVLQDRRDSVLLATKARFPVGEGPNDAGLSRGYLIRACEASLRRLDTDWIDLYQVHERDGETPTEETLDALDTLVHQGKVRYVGCSNFSARHVVEALWTAERHGMIGYVAEQIYYSLLHREAEYELVPVAIDHGLGILVWSPLGGGLLTGKYRRGEPGPEGARHSGGWGPWSEPPIYDEEAMFRVLDALVEVAQGRGASPAQVALAWLIGRPAVTSVIVGARDEGQLGDNLQAAAVTLSPEERARLDEASRVPLIYPYWHQLRFASDRLSAGDLSLLGQHPRS